MNLKPWLLAGLFVVTWNEYRLFPHYWYMNEGKKQFTENAMESVQHGNQFGLDHYTVEMTTHTIKLATQQDVDLFVPRKNIAGNFIRNVDDALNGIIPSNAFNIVVTQESDEEFLRKGGGR